MYQTLDIPPRPCSARNPAPSLRAPVLTSPSRGRTNIWTSIEFSSQNLSGSVQSRVLAWPSCCMHQKLDIAPSPRCSKSGCLAAVTGP
ncbi:hypothetical protein C8R44DRAFT_365956 [Mycena epipterygia]|nr:hypothetical protein C8R44DRAFT_365956 [Mycena epipterygia]